jgi:hypothetical protein
MVSSKMRSVETIQYNAVTKLQAVVRGRQAKQYVEKSRKRLIRQRQARKIERRQKASLKIQCCARQRFARKKAAHRRQMKLDEENERREFEELELSLEGLHVGFMHDLMVIRAQTGARGMLAKK